MSQVRAQIPYSPHSEWRYNTSHVDKLSLLEMDEHGENGSFECVIHTNGDIKISMESRSEASLRTPPIKVESIVEQALYNYYRTASVQVGQPNIDFLIDDGGICMGDSIVENAIHIGVP